MNHHLPATTAGNATDAASTRAFLQQAVDQHPRLAAFSFTLELPYCEAMNEYRSLILLFHAEVWQRVGEYSRERQQERRNSPPTLLRWVWESASGLRCLMMLLMNCDTQATGLDPQLPDSALQELNGIIADAWQKVDGTSCTGVTSNTQRIINRVAQGVFTTSFNQLTAYVKAMVKPIATARRP